MAKVTMQEISKLAGVSPATVSRALHSPHLVRKDTRERITRAMEKLTLSLALTRMKWGKPRDSQPSRFLYEIIGQADNPRAKKS